MKKVGFSILDFGLVGALLLAAIPASAADYFVYKDTAGRTILSNLAPADRPLGQEPGSLTIVNEYRWRDATDAQIAATAAANAVITRENIEHDRVAALERRSDELARSAAKPAPRCMSRGKIPLRIWVEIPAEIVNDREAWIVGAIAWTAEHAGEIESEIRAQLIKPIFLN